MLRPEQAIHKAVMQHIRTRGAPGVFAWHTPNGGYRRPVEAAIFKSLGTVSGIPDILILHNARLHALELKAQGGVVSTKQRETMQAMRLAGAIVDVTYGLDDALRWLESHGLLQGRAA